MLLVSPLAGKSALNTGSGGELLLATHAGFIKSAYLTGTFFYYKLTSNRILA
jgi:hypothetical protein